MATMGLLGYLWLGLRGLCLLIGGALTLATFAGYVALLGLCSPLLLLSGRPCKAFWAVEALAFEWCLNVIGSYVALGGFEVVESGDVEPPAAPDGGVTLLLPNHQSTADVPLMAAVMAAKPGSAAGVMWILDRLFRFTHFGIISWLRGDFFICEVSRGQPLSEIKTVLHSSTGSGPNTTYCCTLNAYVPDASRPKIYVPMTPGALNSWSPLSCVFTSQYLSGQNRRQGSNGCPGGPSER